MLGYPHRRLNGLETLETRVTPSASPLGLPLLPSVPALATPIVAETLTSAHLPSLPLSANLSLTSHSGTPSLALDVKLASLAHVSTELSLTKPGLDLSLDVKAASLVHLSTDVALTTSGLGLSVAADVGPVGLQAAVGTTGPLLALDIHLDLPGLSGIGLDVSIPPVHVGLDHGGLEVHLPIVPEQMLPLGTPPPSPAMLPMLPELPILPARAFIDPSLFLARQSAVESASETPEVVTEAAQRSEFLVSADTELSWTTASGADGELSVGDYDFGPIRRPVQDGDVTWSIVPASDESFDLRDGRLVEEVVLPLESDSMTGAQEDSGPLDTVVDNALMLWLLGVLGSCAAGSLYLTSRKERDLPTLTIDPRLMPIG